jgi:23S rRNA A1618 N6-methylase RlmF
LKGASSSLSAQVVANFALLPTYNIGIESKGRPTKSELAAQVSAYTCCGGHISFIPNVRSRILLFEKSAYYFEAL